MGDKKQRAYDALVTTIHAAVLEPGRWDGLLKRIGEAIDANAGAYYLREKATGHATAAHLYGHAEPVLMLCGSKLAGIDPWTSLADQAQLGEWVHHPRCFDDRLLHRRDHDARTELPRVERPSVACRVFDDGRGDALVGFQRGPGETAFNSTETEFLNRLSPHLELACRLSSEFSRLRLQAAVARQALDRLATPIWVADTDGSVLFTNHAADQGLPGLFVRMGKLLAESPHVASKLSSLISQASGAKPRTGALALDDDDGGRHTLLVAPLPPDSPLAADWRRPLVLLMAHNPSTADAQQPLEVLTALYGLSPAECRLATLLLEGYTPAEAADRLMVQVSTVRTQLKSMFWKTGTHRQGELVKLLSGALLLKA